MKFVLAAALCVAPLEAHHSFAADYDIHRPVRLEGVVTRFDFVNPHAEIYLEVAGVEWWVEAASPHALEGRGISKTTLRRGMRVAIEGFQAKNGSRKAIGRAIVMPGGARLLLDPAGAQAPGSDVK